MSGHAKDGMKMAIDFTEEPYYGKLDMYVTRSKYKSGTYTFHTFATISVVGKDEKERLTLYSLPMLNTKRRYSKEIARKLAKAISIDDKQRFFKTEMIKLLESMNINFFKLMVKTEITLSGLGPPK